MFSNFGLPTKFQWKRILVNTVIYFIGAFVGLLGFTAFESGSVNMVDLSVSTFISALVGAAGATVKFVYTLIFEPPVVKEEKK